MNSTSENKKKLLDLSRKAMRGLHDLFGYDFCKPHEILYLDGKFTVKQVNKLAASAGYGAKSEIVLLTRNKAREGCYDGGLHVVRIVGEGFEVEFSRRIPYYGNRGEPFKCFYRKGNFDNMRKSVLNETWIILQAREFLRLPPQEIKLDLTERFRIGKVDMSRYNGESYVNRVELFRRDGKGERMKYETHGKYLWEGMWKPASVYDIFDKSGWYLRARREDLKRRADFLRADRKKAAYLNIDNTGKVEELQALIDRRKRELAAQLLTATTEKEINAIYNALGWRGLYGIVRDFEFFREKTESRKFSSIEESDRAYNAIKEKLEQRKEEAAA